MLFNKIDWNNLEIPPLAKSENQVGYWASTPTLDGGKQANIQAPMGLFPFGTSPPNLDKNVKKWSISLAKTDNGVTKPIMEQFFSKMEELDEFLVNYAHKHSKDFFGKQLPLETVRAFYNPVLKYDKDPVAAAKYGPRIAPTVGYNEETHTFDDIPCKNIDKKDLPIDKVPRRSKGILQFRLGQVYCVNQKAFGVTLFVTRVDLIILSQEQAKEPNLDAYDDPEMTAALLAYKFPEQQQQQHPTEGAPPNLHAYGDGAADAAAEADKKRERPADPAPAAEPETKKAKGGKTSKK